MSMRKWQQTSRGGALAYLFLYRFIYRRYFAAPTGAEVLKETYVHFSEFVKLIFFRFTAADAVGGSGVLSPSCSLAQPPSGAAGPIAGSAAPSPAVSPRFKLSRCVHLLLVTIFFGGGERCFCC